MLCYASKLIKNAREKWILSWVLNALQTAINSQFSITFQCIAQPFDDFIIAMHNAHLYTILLLNERLPMAKSKRRMLQLLLYLTSKQYFERIEAFGPCVVCSVFNFASVAFHFIESGSALNSKWRSWIISCFICRSFHFQMKFTISNEKRVSNARSQSGNQRKTITIIMSFHFLLFHFFYFV